MRDTGPRARSTTPTRRPTVSSMSEIVSWIAIVDDDPSVLKALRRTLRVRAFQSKTFESAQEFLTSLPDGLPECLIVDLQMPGMTGLELHDYLRRCGIAIPTIIITAHNDNRVRERPESRGLVAVLLKPLENGSLFNAIDAAMKGDRGTNHQPR
jgi:FixJ family two-component response regulator